MPFCVQFSSSSFNNRQSFLAQIEGFVEFQVEAVPLLDMHLVTAGMRCRSCSATVFARPDHVFDGSTNAD